MSNRRPMSELLFYFLQSKEAAETKVITDASKNPSLSDYIEKVLFKPGFAVAFVHLRMKADLDAAVDLMDMFEDLGVRTEWNGKRDRLMIQMTDKLASSIEDYRLDHGHRSTNDAVLALIRKGLEQ